MKIKSVKSINPCISVIQTSYDIVKVLGVVLKVETPPAGRAGKEGEGTGFIIQLPVVRITPACRQGRDEKD